MTTCDWNADAFNAHDRHLMHCVLCYDPHNLVVGVHTSLHPELRQILLWSSSAFWLPRAQRLRVSAVLRRQPVLCTHLPQFENSAQQQPVWSPMSFVFFLFSEFISRLDALHTVLNNLYMHTLPIEQASSAQQIVFRGVMTPSLLPVRPGLH